MTPPRPPVTGCAGAPARVGRVAGRVVTSSLGRVGAGAWAGALAGALVLGGLGEVHHQHVEATRATAVVAAERAAAAQRAHAAAQRLRAQHADSERLTETAVRFSAVRRAEAIAVAREAVRAAEVVVVRTGPEAPPTLGPLGQAAADLAALIDATPAAPVTGRDATRARADRTGVRSDAPASLAAAPVPPDTPPGDVPLGAVPAGAVPAGAVPPTDAPPADVPPTDAPPAAVAPAGPPPAGPPSPGPPPADVPSAVAASTDAPPAGSPTTAVSPTATPSTGTDSLRALDLGVTAEVLAAAQRLSDLSVQVQTETETARAAAAAQAEAEAAARAAAEEAARAAAVELERRIAVADAAPNGEIPEDVLCPLAVAPDALLRCDAAEAFDRLAAVYRADHGRDLDVVSSYRSFSAQVAVKAARGGLAAAPGRSNHGRGIAVDLGGFGGVGQFTAPAYLWMKEHAAEFGWFHPRAMEPGGSAPQEPWHWEYGTEDDATAGSPRR